MPKICNKSISVYDWSEIVRNRSEYHHKVIFHNISTIKLLRFRFSKV